MCSFFHAGGRLNVAYAVMTHGVNSVVTPKAQGRSVTLSVPYSVAERPVPDRRGADRPYDSVSGTVALPSSLTSDRVTHRHGRTVPTTRPEAAASAAVIGCTRKGATSRFRRINK
jgi:hypothetical protein